jgi:cytochrome c-type biogenesis protein CcmE
MKIRPLHIGGLLVIAVGIAVVVSTSGDASTYVCFSEAKELAKEGENEKVHVVGELVKNANGEIEGMVYNPQEDPNFFRFLLVDEKKEKQEVIYFNPKPADFERSEKVVVVGEMKLGKFVADKILMKCPSKYQDNEFRPAEGAGT